MSFAQRSGGGKTVGVGTRSPRGRVVFHADDFGMNRAVTDGIVRAFEHGLLTSTALMANAPDATRALREWQRLAAAHAAGWIPSAAARRQLREPQAPFELGVHLNLTQGRPLTSGYPTELLDARGCFVGVGRLFAALNRRRPHIEPALLAELAAQIEFTCDHGHRPTHLNGHQYIELLPGLRPALRALLARHAIAALRLARERGLVQSTLVSEFRPANWCVARVKRFYAGRLANHAREWGASVPDAYFGTSHAGRINLEILRTFLRSGAGCPLIEIGVHPAETNAADARADDAWHDPLAPHRPRELAMLTSPLLVELVEEFGLSLGRLNETQAGSAARAA